MNEKQFGQFVLTTRSRQKTSQKSLAEKMGVSPQYVSDVEQGRRRASEKFALKFSRAAGLDQVAVSLLVGYVPRGFRPASYDGAQLAAAAFRQALRGSLSEKISVGMTEDHADSRASTMIGSASQDDEV